jgi:hypothetical protein
MNVLLLFKFMYGIPLMRRLAVLPYHHLYLCKFSYFQCLVCKISPWAMPGLRAPKYWSELGKFKCATVSLITYRNTAYIWGMPLTDFFYIKVNSRFRYPHSRPWKTSHGSRINYSSCAKRIQEPQSRVVWSLYCACKSTNYMSIQQNLWKFRFSFIELSLCWQTCWKF